MASWQLPFPRRCYACGGEVEVTWDRAPAGTLQLTLFWPFQCSRYWCPAQGTLTPLPPPMPGK